MITRKFSLIAVQCDVVDHWAGVERCMGLAEVAHGAGGFPGVVFVPVQAPGDCEAAGDGEEGAAASEGTGGAPGAER